MEASKHAPTEQRFVLPAESTAELLARLHMAGPGATIRVLVKTDVPDALIKVIPAPGILTSFDGEPDINHAHPCPPFTDCPG